MGIRFLLIDGLNLIRRVWAAQPGEDGPERLQSAVTSSTQSLARALRECAPTHAVCVLDSGEKGWRHELFPGYKKGRDPMPEILRANIGLFETAFGESGVSTLTVPGYEADDVIATFAVKVAERGGAVIILSTDRIFFQLVSPNIVVRDHFNKRTMNADYVREKYGILPNRFVDFMALAGDSTSTIPGVPLVGPKGAARLINEIGALEDILTVAYTVPGKLGMMLHTHADDARLSQKLARLDSNISLGVNLKSFRYEKT
jgi:protein Xni